MPIVATPGGVPIHLSDERWRHITERHPEMAAERARVLEAVAAPDLVQTGDYGTLLAIRHYPQTTLTSKHVVVVYREVGLKDGFILTAYLTSRPSRRRVILWQR